MSRVQKDFRRLKKEIYFTSDIYNEVAKMNKIKPERVKYIFETFMELFKEFLEETDEISYTVPYLGRLMIGERTAEKQWNRYHSKIHRTDNRFEVERFKMARNNFDIRIKKIRIELNKIRRKKRYDHFMQKRQAQVIAHVLKDSPAINMMGKHEKAFENIKKQNNYAYNFYEEMDIDPSDF